MDSYAGVALDGGIARVPAHGRPGWPRRSSLVQAVQDRWRAVNAPHLAALVRAGAKFRNGKLVERPDATTTDTADAADAAA